MTCSAAALSLFLLFVMAFAAGNWLWHARLDPSRGWSTVVEDAAAYAKSVRIHHEGSVR